jgi:hypothetical protein
MFLAEHANVDYYDGGDRYSRGPRMSAEELMLTRLRKDFISLAVGSFCFLMLESQSSVHDC